jgi:hypothetical protein
MLLSDCVSVAHELHVALSTANSDSATGGDVERDGRGQDEMKGGWCALPPPKFSRASLEPRQAPVYSTFSSAGTHRRDHLDTLWRRQASTTEQNPFTTASFSHHPLVP